MKKVAVFRVLKEDGSFKEVETEADVRQMDMFYTSHTLPWLRLERIEEDERVVYAGKVELIGHHIEVVKRMRELGRVACEFLPREDANFVLNYTMKFVNENDAPLAFLDNIIGVFDVIRAEVEAGDTIDVKDMPDRVRRALEDMQEPRH